ncbi:MAG: AMP-binding protein [Acidobacteria bacterium]|nr:AMP-binding protein [Acidobacteriota bacterium]
MESLQLQRLQSLIELTLRSNSFYGERLRSAGMAEPPASLADFTARAPLTRKQDLVEDQRARPPYGSNLAFPLADYRRMHQTSGTTAAPVRWLDTAESWSALLDGWVRVLQASGVTREDRVFFPFAFGPFCGFWMAFEAAVRMGCLVLPAGGLRSGGRLQMLLDNEATAFCATPTYAIRLGQAAREEGFDLSRSKVRTIVVAGEPGGGIPATRALIEELWPGARVKDHHGMTEVGPVSYECPRHIGRLHVMEADYLAEVLDPQTLEPARPGELGELILTTLHRTASPAIRYRTRDVVRRGDGSVCECGSAELALDGGILSRTDDMVSVRGVNLYPSAVEEVVRAAGGVEEFRVEVSGEGGLRNIALLIETADPEAAARLEEALHKAFGLRFAVSVGRDLPRFEAKASRWARSAG